MLLGEGLPVQEQPGLPPSRAKGAGNNGEGRQAWAEGKRQAQQQVFRGQCAHVQAK